MTSIYLILTASLFHFALGDSNFSNVATYLLLGTSLITLTYNLNPNQEDGRWVRRALYFQLLVHIIAWCIERYLGNDGFWYLDDHTYFEIGKSLTKEPLGTILNYGALQGELGSSDIGFYFINAALQFLFGSSILIIRWFNLACIQFVVSWVIQIFDELQLDRGKRFIALAMLSFLPSLAFWSLFDFKDVLLLAFTVRMILSGISLYDRLRLKDLAWTAISFYGMWNIRNYTATGLIFLLACGYLVQPNGVLGRNRSWKWRIGLVTCALAVLAPSVHYWISTSFWDFFVNFSQGVMSDSNTNSSLNSMLSIYTPVDLLRVAAIGVPHLLFAPIPWQTEGTDSWSFICTFFLLFLYPMVAAGAWTLIKTGHKQRWFVYTSMSLILLFGILWGGGEIRHRFQAEPFLIILAGFGLGSPHLKILYRVYAALLLAMYAFFWDGLILVQVLCILPLLIVLQRLAREMQRLRCINIGDKPRILEITNTDFSAKHLLSGLLTKLHANGWDVSVSCPDGPHLSAFERQGIHVRTLPFKRTTNILRNGWTVLKLTTQLALKPYDIVHVHTPIVAFLARIASFFSCAPCVVYTIHGFYFHEDMPKNKRRFHVWLETVAAWFTDQAFSQSQEDVDTAIEDGIYEQNKIRWIGNGIELEKFYSSAISEYRNSTRMKLGIANDSIVFLTNCRIVREKGVLELIEAFHFLKQSKPNIHLIVVGESLPSDYDGYAKEIDAFVSKNNLLSSIKLVGYQGDVRPFLAAADVFVLNSRREGMPRSIIEAMAAGLPVIANNIRGCREEVIHTTTGLLCKVGERSSLQQALQTLSLDPTLRSRMGRAGCARAIEFFNEEDVITKQLNLLEELLPSHRVPSLVPQIAVT